MFVTDCFHLKCELIYGRFKIITLTNSKDNYVERKFKVCHHLGDARKGDDRVTLSIVTVTVRFVLRFDLQVEDWSRVKHVLAGQRTDDQVAAAVGLRLEVDPDVKNKKVWVSFEYSPIYWFKISENKEKVYQKHPVKGKEVTLYPPSFLEMWQKYTLQRNVRI